MYTSEATEFVPEVLEIAHGFGLEVSADEVMAAMRQARRANETRWTPGPTGQDKWGHSDRAPTECTPKDAGPAGRSHWRANSPHGSLQGWTPTTVRWHDGKPFVHWCFTEGIDFTDPFFDDTVSRCLSDPYRLLFWQQRSLDDLVAWAVSHPGLEPAGLIFHASRCGSTLVAQMFAGLPSTLVLSEPAPLDEVLRSRQHEPGLDDETVAERLRAVVSGLGQPRRSADERLVIKLDAWAILWWPVIRLAFPATPCVFLYREPTEIVASHLARRGSHMVPGFLAPELLIDRTLEDGASCALQDGASRALQDGVAIARLQEVVEQPPERYCAMVLGALLRAALCVARQGQVHLCHYRELPGLVPERLAPLFSVGPRPGGPARFAEAAARDSRNPWLPFASARNPRPPVAPSVEAAVEEFAGAAYASLEAERAGASLAGGVART